MGEDAKEELGRQVGQHCGGLSWEENGRHVTDSTTPPGLFAYLLPLNDFPDRSLSKKVPHKTHQRLWTTLMLL